MNLVLDFIRPPSSPLCRPALCRLTVLQSSFFQDGTTQQLPLKHSDTSTDSPLFLSCRRGVIASVAMGGSGPLSRCQTQRALLGWDWEHVFGCGFNNNRILNRPSSPSSSPVSSRFSVEPDPEEESPRSESSSLTTLRDPSSETSRVPFERTTSSLSSSPSERLGAFPPFHPLPPCRTGSSGS